MAGRPETKQYWIDQLSEYWDSGLTIQESSEVPLFTRLELFTGGFHTAGRMVRLSIPDAEMDYFESSFGLVTPDIPVKQRKLSPEELANLIESIAACQIFDWNPLYENHAVLDGETWTLNVFNGDANILSIKGCNAWPSSWKQFRSLFYEKV